MLLLALSPSAYACYELKNTIFSQLAAYQKSFEIYRLRAKDLYTCSFYAPRRHSIHTQPYEPSHTDVRMLASQSIPQSTAIQPRICPSLTGHALLTEPSAVRKRLWFLSTPTDAHMHQQRIATFDNRSVQAGSSNCCTSHRLQWNDFFSVDHSSLPSVSTFPFGGSLIKSRAAEGQRGGLWGLKTGQESMIKPAS